MDYQEYIFEFIFIGVISGIYFAAKNEKTPRTIRSIARFIVHIMIIISIFSLGVYGIIGVEQGIPRRILSILLAIYMAIQYIKQE